MYRGGKKGTQESLWAKQGVCTGPVESSLLNVSQCHDNPIESPTSSVSTSVASDALCDHVVVSAPLSPDVHVHVEQYASLSAEVDKLRSQLQSVYATVKELKTDLHHQKKIHPRQVSHCLLYVATLKPRPSDINPHNFMKSIINCPVLQVQPLPSSKNCTTSTLHSYKGRIEKAHVWQALSSQ